MLVFSHTRPPGLVRRTMEAIPFDECPEVKIPNISSEDVIGYTGERLSLVPHSFYMPHPVIWRASVAATDAGMHSCCMWHKAIWCAA
jgi:hypothetical protein